MSKRPYFLSPKRARLAMPRRTFLKGAAATGALAAAAGLAAPAVHASDRSIKIGSYGGYFEDSFVEHVYPAFTKATGIKVESVTQPNSNDWLITMEQATKAGAVPADLSLYGKDTMIRANNLGVLAPYDSKLMPAADNLGEIYRYDPGAGVIGVGAMAWYTSMVINTEALPTPPASWTEFWDANYADSLGMAANFDARLLDIAAKTFFGEPAEVMASQDGIMSVIEKCAELKANTKIWWKAESAMQNALQNEEVVGGMYYHDVTGLMAADGFPVASIFPKEGNVIGYGSWCLSSASKKTAEAHEFVNFSSTPEIQALMSRKIGTAPLVAKSLTDLTDDEFNAVSSEQDPIVPAYESYLANADFISDNWNKMLTS